MPWLRLRRAGKVAFRIAAAGGLLLLAGVLLLAAAPPNLPIDFSFCGYGGGGVPLPAAAARVVVVPSGGDDTDLLQQAIDHVGGLPAGADGIRGAVQLAPGEFRVGGQLRLRGGVVLRGSVDPARPTVLIATGHDRRTLIEVAGSEPQFADAIERKVTDDPAPAGTRTLPLDNVDGLAPGDGVAIRRPSTKEWISAIGMDQFTGHFKEFRLDWAPGSRDLVWNRVITAVDALHRTITVDAPITVALEVRYGGGTVRRVDRSRLARQVGIVYLNLVSEFDRANPRDEEHSWIAIAVDHAEDVWVRGIIVRHFVCSAVSVGSDARRITVDTCYNEKPVSEPGGYRRLSFFVNGQQVLVQRCYAEQGWDDFAAGMCAAGPNVFRDCEATAAIGDSGPFESWAAGTLYELVRVDGAGIALANNSRRAQGAGWTAANSVLGHCLANPIDVASPHGAENRAVANLDASSPPGAENYANTELYLGPGSLYDVQLAARIGPAAMQALERCELGSSEAQRFVPAAVPDRAKPLPIKPLALARGRFVIDGRALWGGVRATAWWKGQVSPALARTLGVSLTRFVPGRTGPGLTEDLAALARDLVQSGTVAFQDWPGLWYDRRRDDHTLDARTDAAVWAPFYEMPWARSGQGTANDGLSKYDLTKFNPWYFDRLREFAQSCDETGLIFIHNFYNTHNVLETGAHWVDFPWRPANCINDTGLPEPAFDADGHSVHIANTFFDASDPRRRELHRAYILHGLDVLKGHPNVVHGLAFQYAGPLAFQQFFLDTVAEWEKANGQTVRLAITTSQDTTDAILADPVRGPMISVIDLRYWQYLPDGTLYAPRGGQNLAFREMSTQRFGKEGGDTAPPTTPEQVYRQVREYRDRYPDRAIMAWHGGCGPIPVLMAGGALALVSNPASGQTAGGPRDDDAFNAFVNQHLAAILPSMDPVDGLVAEGGHTWCLTDRKTTWLIDSLSGESFMVRPDVPVDACRGLWFDPRTGQTTAATLPARGEGGNDIHKPSAAAWLLLLQRP